MATIKILLTCVIGATAIFGTVASPIAQALSPSSGVSTTAHITLADDQNSPS